MLFAPWTLLLLLLLTGFGLACKLLAEANLLLASFFFVMFGMLADIKKGNIRRQLLFSVVAEGFHIGGGEEEKEKKNGRRDVTVKSMRAGGGSVPGGGQHMTEN